MKGATLDPSVNAHKSNKFMWVYPCCSTYTLDNLKELRKFKSVLSELSFQNTEVKQRKSSILSSFMSIIPLTFNY